MIQTIRTLLAVVTMILLAVSSAGAYSPTTDSYQAQLYKMYTQENPDRPDKDGVSTPLRFCAISALQKVSRFQASTSATSNPSRSTTPRATA